MSGSSTIGVVGTTNFFGILRFLPITKDRKQLRTANKNYLVIKQTSTHENIHPTLLLPGNDAGKKVLITHNYGGSQQFLISKSVEPNKELKVE